MWIDNQLIQREWRGGAITIDEILYEFEGPVVFSAFIGLNRYLFAKRDETEDFDYFIAVETEKATVDALREGRISLKGALTRDSGWLIEADNFNVSAFQLIPDISLDRFMPASHVGLLNSFGIVPDTLEQAEAFIAFRFLGRELRKGVVPLSALKAMVDEFSLFVKKALTPPSLNNGKDYRYFDLPMVEPKFSSLVLAAKKPEYELGDLQRNVRLRDVDPNDLIAQTGQQGQLFWNSLERATDQIENSGTLSRDFIQDERIFLDNIAGLMPSNFNSLDNVEITFNDGLNFRTILLNKAAGQTIIEARDESNLSNKAITGVITEVNGDAKTFIIKDITERQTTCSIPSDYFDRLDAAGSLRRGRQLMITGSYDPRTRRGKIWTDQPLVFLN